MNYPLADLVSVLGAAGVAVGGTVGFSFPYVGSRRIAENVALGSACGLVVANLFAFVIGFVYLISGN